MDLIVVTVSLEKNINSRRAGRIKDPFYTLREKKILWDGQQQAQARNKETGLVIT